MRLLGENLIARYYRRIAFLSQQRRPKRTGSYQGESCVSNTALLPYTRIVPAEQVRRDVGARKATRNESDEHFRFHVQRCPILSGNRSAGGCRKHDRAAPEVLADYLYK